jgi:hypothetical protein
MGTQKKEIVLTKKRDRWTCLVEEGDQKYVEKRFIRAEILSEEKGYLKLEKILANNRLVKELIEKGSNNKGYENIRKIYKVGNIDEPFPCIVLEYIKYNLNEYLKEKGGVIPSVDQAVQIILDVCYGLKFFFDGARKQGMSYLCHGDICPENIYIQITEESKIIAKLGDFDGATMEFTSISPFETHMEWKPNDPEFNEKYDVYSLGLTLATMIAGKKAKDAIQISGCKAIDEYKEIPSEIRELIKKSTEVQNERISLDEFIKNLEHIKGVIKPKEKIIPKEKIDKEEVRNTGYKILEILEDIRKSQDIDRYRRLEPIIQNFLEISQLWKRREEEMPKSRIMKLLEQIKKELS